MAGCMACVRCHAPPICWSWPQGGKLPHFLPLVHRCRSCTLRATQASRCTHPQLRRGRAGCGALRSMLRQPAAACARCRVWPSCATSACPLSTARLRRRPSRAAWAGCPSWRACACRPGPPSSGAPSGQRGWPHRRRLAAAPGRACPCRLAGSSSAGRQPTGSLPASSSLVAQQQLQGFP